MKNILPNYVLNAQWDCIEKVHSRIITIIDLYKKLYNRDSIPDDEQFWSMCGAHFNPISNLEGEFGHLIKSNLIKPNQYFGIDKELSVIEGNKKVYPNTTWINDDFYRALNRALIYNTFNPAIINYDGVMQPKYGMQYLKSILMMLDYNVSKELLLVSNFILTNPRNFYSINKNKYTIADALDCLKKIYLLPDHWDIFPQAYTYTSPSRKAKAEMGIIVFIKKEHDINDIKYTTNRKIGM